MYRPATRNAGVKSLPEPRNAGPFGNAKDASIKLHLYNASLVLLLFFACRPTAVFGAIIPLPVDSIERVFAAGPFTHVGGKQIKIEPSSANTYSLSAVEAVIIVGPVGASTNHSTPCFEKGVTGTPFSWGATNAIAAQRDLEFPCGNKIDMPAPASAFPYHRLKGPLVGWPNGDEITEHFSCQVLWDIHGQSWHHVATSST